MGPGVRPGLFVTTADAPSPSHSVLSIFLMLTRFYLFLLDLQPFQLVPAALSNFNDLPQGADLPQAAVFHNYEVPSELCEDTYGVHYTAPLLFSNQAMPTVPINAFPQQPLSMGMQPLSMSAQPLPSLRPIQVST